MLVDCAYCLLLPDVRYFGVIRRCDGCGRLWRRAWACNACDRYGVEHSLRGGGECTPGLAWRPATWVQQLRWARIPASRRGPEPPSSRPRRGQPMHAR